MYDLNSGLGDRFWREMTCIATGDVTPVQSPVGGPCDLPRDAKLHQPGSAAPQKPQDDCDSKMGGNRGSS